ncbi:tRNA selenocysteine 1-associated protein 1 [Sergentomyia squamirostris]
MVSTVHCQLWMGSLEPYMTENFIMAAFQKMGEDPQTVKLMRNKYTGEPAGYCFVNFLNDEQAIDAMHKLNGKPIPGTNPIVRFRLNSASNQSKALGIGEREFSVWVGDLSSDVDDYSLYRAFSNKYTSIKAAKVILDSSGFSKGYGFVRFGLEDEQKNALYEMNGYIGLGSRPLKICNAVPKPKGATTTTPTTPTPSATSILQNAYSNAAAADYSQYYDPSYWQGYSWQGYYEQQPGTDATSYYQAMTTHPTGGHVTGQTDWSTHHHSYEPPHEDEDMSLVEHKFTLDTDKLNRETVDRDRNLWDALESSKWLPIEQLEIF